MFNITIGKEDWVKNYNVLDDFSHFKIKMSNNNISYTREYLMLNIEN